MLSHNKGRASRRTRAMRGTHCLRLALPRRGKSHPHYSQGVGALPAKFPSPPQEGGTSLAYLLDAFLETFFVRFAERLERAACISAVRSSSMIVSPSPSATTSIAIKRAGRPLPKLRLPR